MTKKNMGLARTERIRIHTNTRTDLDLIQKIFKMSSTHNEGDVIQELVRLFNTNEYKQLYEDLVKTNSTLKKCIDLLCEKQGIKFADAMEMVRCQT